VAFYSKKKYRLNKVTLSICERGKIFFFKWFILSFSILILSHYLKFVLILILILINKNLYLVCKNYNKKINFFIKLINFKFLSVIQSVRIVLELQELVKLVNHLIYYHQKIIVVTHHAEHVFINFKKYNFLK
jgi:hypothetical protein